MIKEWKRSGISMVLLGFLLVSACLGLTITVKSEVVQMTILEEGFESGMPDDWGNTGWLENYYGSPHNGSNWTYSWAAGDTLTTPSLNFGQDTELSFWYCAEIATNPMDLEVYIDTNDVSNMIWNDAGFTHTSYQQVIIDLSGYTGDHTILFIAMTSDMHGQLLDDIVITSYVEADDEPVDDPDDGNGGGGGGILPPAENIPPVADLSKGEPYDGYTNGSVFFDGSLSYDPDGEIVKWFWTMGDGTQKTGETLSYQYTEAGTYTVTLHVLDDSGAETTDITNVTILEGNYYPSQPVIKISSIPRFNNIFEIIDVDNAIDLMISSADEDDDFLTFTIDWGDGTIETTTPVDSGARFDVNHSWEKAGRYEISVIAIDTHNATSETTTVTVLMNLKYMYITGDITGYLIDYDNNGTYSKFFNADTNIETTVQKDSNDTYLIDADDDGAWDYTYNKTAGVNVYRSGKDGQSEEQSTDTPGFEVLIYIASLVLIVIIERKRR